jgi:hypothetical protein
MGLIAYVGFFPLLRGSRQILSAGFRPAAVEPIAASTGAIFRQTVTGGMDAAAALIPIFALHTPAEAVPVAAGVLVAAGLLARAHPDRVARFRPGALVLIGVYLLIEGGAFGWMWR